MNIVKTQILNHAQFEQINRLWDEEYPRTLKGRFKNLLDGVEYFNHYLIESDDKVILAWAVEFKKDSEIRFSIIVDNRSQGKGFGKQLVEKLKENLDDFHGWVIDHDTALKENGDLYRSPLSFYQKLGFQILSDQRIDNETLKAVKIRWNRNN